MNRIQIDQALVDKMVDQAILESAEEFFAGDTRRMRQAILQGHCDNCRRIIQSIVRQIGEYLGQVDRTVKAVYHYEPVETPEVHQSEISEPYVGINLLVWVERKSAALSALLETLKTSLEASQRNIACANASLKCFSLDVKMVTDQEVMERRGLGLLVESPFLHSTSIWSRSNQVEQLSPKEATETRKAQLVLPEMFDPELMPEGRLLEHALSIENIPHEERGTLEHHLTELKVVLIRRLISDQLAYINIAKKWFKVKDLAEIYRRKIGLGRIGGKAAGMLLAANILKETMDDTLRASLSIPESFFLGSDVMYIFLSMNGLMYWNDQKYKPEVQIREEYPRIIEYFEAGSFPPEILIELRDLLAIIGEKPLIVRSSSLLEDNFGTAFAGKYDSHFCPNQGSIEENLKALTLAIARTYASTLKPDALLYRRSKGLQDYDERMAVLIQIVEGERYRQYYLPFGAGVAFSRNLYRWSPQIRKEDGYVRLVWGLGTRAVQRVGNDYPRLVALSHPNLLPKDTPEAIRQYSQQYVDLIDLEDNSFKTLPVTEVLKPDYGALRYLTLLEQDGYFTPIRTRLSEADVPRTVITFGELIRRTPFADTLSKILKSLEQHYHSAVDLEFAVHVVEPSASQPEAKITLLQCRPQSYLRPAEDIRLPKDLPEDQVIFSTRFMVPRGRIRDIRYIIYISPEAYFALPSEPERAKLGRLVSRLNSMLPAKSFICLGPGRWGTVNADLGIPVGYADIDHCAALIEVSGSGQDTAPEPSLGTHFFQDLMEAEIYPLALLIDQPDTYINSGFFHYCDNSLGDWLPEYAALNPNIKLIDVEAYKPGHHVELVMDDEQGQALAFFIKIGAN